MGLSVKASVLTFLGLRVRDLSPREARSPGQAGPSFPINNPYASIALELLETERTYVAKTETLVEAFVLPMRSWIAEMLAGQDSGDRHPSLNALTCR
jgi:hypothetical protein